MAARPLKDALWYTALADPSDGILDALTYDEGSDTLDFPVANVTQNGSALGGGGSAFAHLTEDANLWTDAAQFGVVAPGDDYNTATEFIAAYVDAGAVGIQLVGHGDGFSAQQAGDGFFRAQLAPDGTLRLGSGAAASDARIERSAAKTINLTNDTGDLILKVNGVTVTVP